MDSTNEVVFLGVNDAGMKIYEWLCKQDDVHVQSLLTTKKQLKIIKELQPDYIVACGFRHIVPKEILKIPHEGCLNIHPAYLPYNRGANPNVWSIVEDTPAGVTIHWMDEQIDTGDIIAQKKVESGFSDTGKVLHEKLEKAQVELFRKVWADILEGNIGATEQNQAEGTYHRTEEFEELCKLDPNEEVQVKEFLDRLRALTFPPYENAEIEVDGETYHVEVDIWR